MSVWWRVSVKCGEVRNGGVLGTSVVVDGVLYKY